MTPPKNKQERILFNAAWDGWNEAEDMHRVLNEEMNRCGFRVKDYSDPEMDFNSFDFSDNNFE